MKLLHFGTYHLHVFFVKADQTYDSFFFFECLLFFSKKLKKVNRWASSSPRVCMPLARSVEIEAQWYLF